MQGDEVWKLASSSSRVGLVLQYRKDWHTPHSAHWDNVLESPYLMGKLAAVAAGVGVVKSLATWAKAALRL